MDDHSLQSVSDMEKPTVRAENFDASGSLESQSVEKKDFAHESAYENSSAEQDSQYGQALARVQNASPSDDALADIAQDASEAHQQPDREQQIQRLVDLTVSKGLDHAVATAEQLGDYYMMDQLHDRLLHDDLHEKLIQSGVLKKES